MDYSTVEFASAAKLTQCCLREKGSHFQMAHRGHTHRVYKLLRYSSGRAVISDITVPNSNARRDKLLREFSETTLPEKTTLTSRAKYYALVKRRKLSLNVSGIIRERKIEPGNVEQYSSLVQTTAALKLWSGHKRYYPSQFKHPSQ